MGVSEHGHGHARTHRSIHISIRLSPTTLLTGLGVAHGLQPDVVDVRVGVVVAGAGDRDVELARQVGPLRVAQVAVGDHVVDVLAV